MKVQKNVVCSVHYTAKAGDAVVDSSHQRGSPLVYLHGRNQIVSGLEEALDGRSMGDKFSVTVPPEKAYGLRSDTAMQRVPRKHLAKIQPLQAGTVVQLQTEQGIQICTVIKVGLSVVDLDLNHPLAGQALEFDIDLVNVRDATAEELQHGHAHGEGGVQHED